MKPLSKLGKDSNAFAPLESDFRRYGPNLIKLFFDQPNIARILAGDKIQTIELDGSTEFEVPTWSDIGRPGVAMKPGELNSPVRAASVVVKLPQIFHRCVMSNDDWSLLFAGKNRQPFQINRMMEKIKIEEDYVAFQGNTKVGLSGLISGLTHDMGAPPGHFGIDGTGDGILEHFQTAIENIMTYFAGLGIPATTPIDMAVTQPIWNLAKFKIIPYQPQVTNLDIARNKLNGGQIHASNNIQAPGVPVDTTHNTLVMMVRTSMADASWQLLSSGFEQKRHEVNEWETSMAMREKFSVQIINGTLVAWYDEISVATT